MYDRDWPIWTDQIVAAPAKFVHDEEGRRGMAISSLISQDCIVSGATRAAQPAVHRGQDGQLLQRPRSGDPALLQHRRGARLSRVIIDSGCAFPKAGGGRGPRTGCARFRRTESGVCLITSR
jgi:glucose-1-phosphate adenylyltransferase